MKCPRCNGRGEVKDPGTLAERLTAIRESRGYTRKDVEDGAKILHSTYWRLENGTTLNPALDDLVRLANFLNVSVDYLVGRKS